MKGNFATCSLLQLQKSASAEARHYRVVVQNIIHSMRSPPEMHPMTHRIW